MIKRAKNKKFTINIDGPMGNAFALMAEAKGIMRQLKWGSDKQNEVLGLMKLSDYVNLVRTFDSFFGSFVDIETKNSELLNSLKGE